MPLKHQPNWRPFFYVLQQKLWAELAVNPLPLPGNSAQSLPLSSLSSSLLALGAGACWWVGVCVCVLDGLMADRVLRFQLSLSNQIKYS